MGMYQVAKKWYDEGSGSVEKDISKWTASLRNKSSSESCKAKAVDFHEIEMYERISRCFTLQAG